MSDRFDNIRIKPESEKEIPKPEEKDISLETPPAGIKTSVPVSQDKQDELPEKPPARSTRGRSVKRSRKKFKYTKLLIWCSIPGFSVLLYIVGSYLFIPSLIKGPVARNLSESLNRPVTVNRVIFSPLTLKFFLRDIHIGGLFGDAHDGLLLECREVQGQIGLEQIFRGQVVIHYAVVDGFSLNMERVGAGSLDIKEMVRFLSAESDDRQSLWPDWLVLNGINIRDGQILLDDPRIQKQHRIEQIQLYLPATGNLLELQSDLPRLKAVFNSSPVQVDGHRTRNNEGKMETRFNFALSHVVLSNYLEYLPLRINGGLQFIEGLADINLSLMIPESSTSQNIELSGTANVEGIRVENTRKQTVFKIPNSYVDFVISPVAKHFHFNKILLESPELNFSVLESTSEHDRNFSLSDVDNWLKWYVKSSDTVSCDFLQWKNGTISLVQGTKGSPSFVWTNVSLSLEELPARKSRFSAKADAKVASFTISGQDKNETTPTQLSINGDVYSGSSVQGKLSVSDFELKKYSTFMPSSVKFNLGSGSLEGAYRFDGNVDNKQVFKFFDGQFKANDYSILGSDQKNILTGKQLTCLDLAADLDKKILSCERLDVNFAEIYSDKVKFSSKKTREGSSSWRIVADDLLVRESTLYKSLVNPLNNKRNIQLKLEKFTLEAHDLKKADHAGNNIQASGNFAQGGTLNISGMYSLDKDNGSLKTELLRVGPRLLKPFFSPWFIPVMRTGLVDVKGTYFVGKDQFDGSITMDNFVAGHRKQSYVSIDKASSDSVHLSFTPFHLTVDEMVIMNPVVVPGLSDAGKTADIFFRTSMKSLKNSMVAIDTVRVENGRYRLAEPVLFPGYQPEVTSIEGVVSSIGGGAETISYTFNGALNDQATFKVTGVTELNNLSSYSLKVNDFPLNKYDKEFQVEGGLKTSKGSGSWHQVMLREEDRPRVSSRIVLKNVRPDMDSKYARIASFYIDSEHTIRIDTKEKGPEEDDMPFLFQSIIRYLQRDAVKAELSQQLVLKKLFPDLQIDEQVLFVPGTTAFVDPSSIVTYRELLKTRPHLLLEFKGGFDPALDRAALQSILQQEEDAKRDAENKRRQQEREKILEQERAKLAAMKEKQDKVVEEDIQSWELKYLQPLAPSRVEVSDEMLTDLARRRAAVLRKHCISQLYLPPDRVVVSGDTKTSGTLVQVEIHPYLNQLEPINSVNENDTEPDRENKNSQTF